MHIYLSASKHRRPLPPICADITRRCLRHPRLSSPLILVIIAFQCSLGLSVLAEPIVAQMVAPGFPDQWVRQPAKESKFGVAPGRSQVIDRKGLKEIKTFCVSTRHLEPAEQAELQEFLAEEGQPGKLLSRLPWKLTEDCTRTDAVARVYFAPVEVDVVVTTELNERKELGPERRSQPVLLVYDKASVRLFYRAEGRVLRGDPSKVFGSPFSILVRDLKSRSR